jgi:carboxyl-terminal processing protease
MSFQKIRQIVASASLVLASSCSVSAEQPTDYNEVGKQVAILLQNTHFARNKWDKQLSNKFLETFLRDMDPKRVYFTQTDVTRFQTDYGDKIHELLLKKECISAANDIYNTFKQRVTESTAFVNKILKEEEFDFTKDESVERTRKNAPWAKNRAESENLWRLNIKEALLGETLRRETVARLAKEQGKEDPLAKEKSPKEKVRLRYERLMHSVAEADEEDVANYFLSAVTKTFDPHTEYMGYREIARFKDSMKNQLVGIGAMLQAEEDGATIIKGIVVGGPADKGGQLKLNDRIVGVDSLNTGEITDIMFMKIDKVVDLIRGKEATEVRLKVEPAGASAGETSFITISRGKVEMKDEQASAQIFEKKDSRGRPEKLGWITLPSFYMDFDKDEASCAKDVEKLLRRLMEEKISGLIIDLRGNGGGSLEEVRRMTGFFIERGPVVQVKNELGQIEVKDSELREPIYDGPLVVLIDRTSASASEILAGALQDHNRAVIVGDTSTFGKGTVQQLMDVGRMMPFFARRDRAGTVKVTLQKFYRPSGDSTQLQGVISDIALPSFLDGLEVGESFLDNRMEFDRIRRASDFEPLDRDHLFVPRLKELSHKRVKENKDLVYINEDVAEIKKKIADNKESLNKEVRDKELADSDAKRHARNKERLLRFAEMAKSDKAGTKFYKLSLADISENKPPHEFDPAAENEDYMRKAKDETADLDDTPKWPSGMDSVKREGLAILSNLVEMTEASKTAGVLKKTAER